MRSTVGDKEWDGNFFYEPYVLAILFSRKSLPISCEIEEIVKGYFLKVKAKFENVIMTFLKYLCT